MEKKILAVDNDKAMLEVLNRALSKEGYEVQMLTHAEKLFSEVATFQPDLILLDVMPSGLDGTIICSALKTFPETQHIPVIFLSGNFNAASTMFTGAQGAPDDFVLKPFTIGSLIDKIEYQLAA